FSIFTGIGLVIAYALLGSTWLIMKTEGEIQRQMYRLTRTAIWALLAVIVILRLWTPLLHERIAERWFSMPNIFWFAPVPVLVVLVSLALLRALAAQRQVAPFVLTLCLVFLGYSGLGISIWPYVIPPDITLRDAASSPQSMGFTLVGALLIIPIILMYTAWGYSGFRATVGGGGGWH